ncbi:uncharacterized protein [Apostichopus japonicus]|uniref:uncharacterized protein isoform X3 n=1 Tax=Stichopus japonicus TaxID=307972 RepID=UPI003AB507C3
MLTIVLQWKGLLKCSNHSFSLRWTLISLIVWTMLTIVLQWKGLLKCSNHSFSLRWTLISLAMERALEVFQPFLFLKMDVNITGRLTEGNDMQLMCNKQIRRLKTASVTIVVVQWKGLLKCSNHSFSLRWTLISLAMERALEVFQPFLFLKMDVNITAVSRQCS